MIIEEAPENIERGVDANLVGNEDTLEVPVLPIREVAKYALNEKRRFEQHLRKREEKEMMKNLKASCLDPNVPYLRPQAGKQKLYTVLDSKRIRKLVPPSFFDHKFLRQTIYLLKVR